MMSLVRRTRSRRLGPGGMGTSVRDRRRRHVQGEPEHGDRGDTLPGDRPQDSRGHHGGGKCASAGQWGNARFSACVRDNDRLSTPRYPVTGGEWPLTFSVVAGPSIGLLVSCKVDYPAGASVDCEDIPPSPYYGDRTPAGLDFSGIFGIGFDFYHFAFQARYDLSITDSYSDVSTLAPILKNVAWELTLGYKFAIH